MPRRKRPPTPNYDTFDEDFDDEDSSNGSRNPPIQRNAANARERARMRVLSSAFCRLKTKLPNIPPDTKLSKLDTLRLATIYIQQLKALLEGESMNDTSALTFHTSNTQNLAYTWPFTFQKLNSNMHQHHHVSTTTTNTFGNGWSSPIPTSSLSKYHDKFYDNESNYMYDNNNGYTINTRM